jgi:hypothetical protein
MIGNGAALGVETMKTAGQIAYEQECEVMPRYHDCTHRLSWHELSDIARWSWERNPTPRWEKKRDAEYKDQLDERPEA